ncbi:hypothetical protein K440DRAFT_662970 [Wilcoxina mikolae CBS 423.85]|nr:hypothetical protein K440DRAFT_662970 [Wilcoxina mikolae CBS 423.85]
MVSNYRRTGRTPDMEQLVFVVEERGIAVVALSLEEEGWYVTSGRDGPTGFFNDHSAVIDRRGKTECHSVAMRILDITDSRCLSGCWGVQAITARSLERNPFSGERPAGNRNTVDHSPVAIPPLTIWIPVTGSLIHGNRLWSGSSSICENPLLIESLGQIELGWNKPGSSGDVSSPLDKRLDNSDAGDKHLLQVKFAV